MLHKSFDFHFNEPANSDDANQCMKEQYMQNKSIVIITCKQSIHAIQTKTIIQTHERK